MLWEVSVVDLLVESAAGRLFARLVLRLRKESGQAKESYHGYFAVEREIIRMLLSGAKMVPEEGNWDRTVVSPIAR